MLSLQTNKHTNTNENADNQKQGVLSPKSMAGIAAILKKKTNEAETSDAAPGIGGGGGGGGMGGIAAMAAAAALKKKKKTNKEEESSDAAPGAFGGGGMGGIAAMAAAGARNKNEKNNTNSSHIQNTHLESKHSSDSDMSYGTLANTFRDRSVSNSQVESQSSADSILLYGNVHNNIDKQHDNRNARPCNPLANSIYSVSSDEPDDVGVRPLARPVARRGNFDLSDSMDIRPNLSLDLSIPSPSDECDENLAISGSKSMDSELSYDDTATLNTSSSQQTKSGRKTYNSTVLRPKTGRHTYNSTVLRPLEQISSEGSNEDTEDEDELKPLHNKGNDQDLRPQPEADVQGRKKKSAGTTLTSQESFESQESDESINTTTTTKSIQTIQSFARKTDLAFQTLTERAQTSVKKPDEDAEKQENNQSTE